EKIKIEAWLDIKKTGEGSKFVLDEADEERLFREFTANVDNVGEVRSFRPGRDNRRLIPSGIVFRLAASILLLVAASAGVWYFAGDHPQAQEVFARQDVEKVILGDGSIVWLRKDSRLTYSGESGGARQAALSGEGLFEVAKDPVKPFVISCGGQVQVRVLGTSFNLKTISHGVELNVLTGKVNVSSPGREGGIDVRPNERIVYDVNGRAETTAFGRNEISALIGRTEYNMQFRNNTMASVIERIEKKFDVEVNVGDPKVKNCRITADFTDHSLVKTLSMMSEFLDVEFTVSGNLVTITGRGCN
ncbi:MAG TPA: FecR domain-containing protein, partial [Chryseosolibacter sp.]